MPNRLYISLLLLMVAGLTLAACQERDAELVVKPEPTFVPVEPDQPAERPTLPPIDEETPLADRHADENHLVVAFDAGWAPYTMVTADGLATGFDVEVVSAILDRAGYTYSFAPSTWARAVTDLRVGRADLLLSMSITNERSQVVQFTRPYAHYRRVIFVHRDNDDIGGATPEELIESLAGKRVGVPAKATEVELWREAREITVIEAASIGYCFDQLTTGQVDACSADQRTGEHFRRARDLPIRQAGPPWGVWPYASAFSLALDEAHVARYNRALSAIQDDGTFATIRARWFGAPPPAPVDEAQSGEAP